VRKSAKTIRTYLEAAQWLAAGYLIPAGLADWDEVKARHVQEWIITLLGRYSDCSQSAFNCTLASHVHNVYKITLPQRPGN